MSDQVPKQLEGSGRAARNLAAVVLLSTLLGRVLAPALVGSRAGIEAWIETLTRAAAFATQTTTWACLFALASLAIRSLRFEPLGLGYRLFILPVGAAVATLVALATKHALDARAHIGLAWASSALALAATPGLLRSVETRAFGLALGLTGIGCCVQAVARSITWDADPRVLESAIYLARLLVSAATLLECCTLAIVVTWLGRLRRPVNPALISVGILVSVVVSLEAAQGRAPDAGFFRVLLSRMLGELSRSPAPLFSPPFVDVLRVTTLVLAGLTLALPLKRGGVGALFCMLLVSGTSADIPFFAVVLTVTALLGRLYALHNEMRDASMAVVTKSTSRQPQSAASSTPGPSRASNAI